MGPGGVEKAFLSLVVEIVSQRSEIPDFPVGVEWQVWGGTLLVYIGTVHGVCGTVCRACVVCGIRSHTCVYMVFL